MARPGADGPARDLRAWLARHRRHRPVRGHRLHHAAAIRDFGVRMALGATPERYWSPSFGEGLRLTAAGLLFGFALSLAVGRALGSMLYGVTPTDARTYARRLRAARRRVARRLLPAGVSSFAPRSDGGAAAGIASRRAALQRPRTSQQPRWKHHDPAHVPSAPSTAMPRDGTEAGGSTRAGTAPAPARPAAAEHEEDAPEEKLHHTRRYVRA